MDRRDFFKQTGAAAAAIAAGTGIAKAQAVEAPLATVAAPYVAPAVRELRVATPWPQTGRGFDDSVRRLAQSIHTLSEGQFRLTFQLGQQGIDAMLAGDADLYHGPSQDLVALDRAFGYFAGLPGKSALRPTYLSAWLTSAGGQTLWDDLSAQYGFKPLLAGHSGARAKLWSRNPIENVSALQGLRVAVTGLAADVVGDLGATAVPVPPSELADALTRGNVDAVEWGGTIAGFGCDLHQAARYVYRPGLARAGFSTVLAMRSGTWAELTPSAQAIFAMAAANELNTLVAESLSVSSRLRTALQDRHGTAFPAMPSDVTEAAVEAADRVVTRVASASPFAARIHASYMTFRAGLPGTRRKRNDAPVA